MRMISLNTKLLVIVTTAVMVIASAVIVISSSSGLQQLNSASALNEERIAALLAKQSGGNIKFGKTESLDKLFTGFAADDTFNLAYAGAVKASGEVIAETELFEGLGAKAVGLAQEAIASEDIQSYDDSKFHMVAAPAHFGKKNAIVGSLIIAWDKSPRIAGAMVSAGQAAAIALAIAIVAMGGLAFILGYLVTKPLKRLTATAVEISNNSFDVDVPGAARRDELGAMARAVQVFRENGQKMAHLTEEERIAVAARTAERAEMMSGLQEAFGTVVSAAVAGDFSRRVEVSFPDPELSSLASEVNNLVDTVDKGLSETADVLAALAHTDLTHRVSGTYQGAFLKLKNDTNAVADKLSEIMGQLRETSGGLKIATSEILAGANDLSERTTRQAATIEETSASMEDLSNTVSENVKKAEAVTEKTHLASKLAKASGDVMTEATSAMERITSSSSKISNIIGMIDDIAFQTNLLALNASVEAARAGEAGKGFAVVAVEVRRLAQSAADASSEVKQLVEQSAGEVSGGSRLVADAAEKLREMLAAVEENAQLMSGISAASNEQATAIQEVGAAVRQMDELTQHNAALVEETNAAIEQTESQARDLDKIIEIFRVDANGSPSSATAKKEPVAAVRTAQATNGNTAIAEDWAEF